MAKRIWSVAPVALLIATLPTVNSQAAPSSRAARSPNVARAVQGAPTVSIDLKPIPLEAGRGEIARLQVTLRFSGIRVAAGAPIGRMASVADNVDTVATVLSDLTARDEQGSIELNPRDVDLPVEDARDSETGGPSREWIAQRATQGPITLTYSVPAKAVLPPRGPAGPLEFRNDDGGVSAAGNVFLLMPPGGQRYRIQIAWNLSALPVGARGLSSLGEGKVMSVEPMSSSELRMTYFMAGKIGGWPRPASGTEFFSAWQGSPPFDAAELMKWTSDLYGHYRTFFSQTKPTPYGVFLRLNPVNSGGGTGFFRSFVITYGEGEGSDPEALKSTLAHEMFHTFQPFITMPAGKASSWFGEGLAVFYEGALPYRYGMMSSSAFIKTVNFTASRYYSSVMATLPNSAIADRFWKDTRVRTLAYDRGMLYFATVDEAVRKASDGQHTLDDLMLDMLRRSHNHGGLTNADWEAVLTQYLGSQGVADFHAFLEGAMPIPSPQAFGPCFTRTTATVRRYELGFEPAVLAEPRRIVRGLVPGSAAAAAGLRNGDEILKPVRQDQIQGDQKEILKLDIRRGDQALAIAYLPRGEQIDVYQWKLKQDAPASQCGS